MWLDDPDGFDLNGGAARCRELADDGVLRSEWTWPCGRWGARDDAEKACHERLDGVIVEAVRSEETGLRAANRVGESEQVRRQLVGRDHGTGGIWDELVPNLPRRAVDDTETIHAVPMPITIRPRGYGPELFAAVKAQAGVSELMTAQARMSEAKTLF